MLSERGAMDRYLLFTHFKPSLNQISYIYEVTAVTFQIYIRVDVFTFHTYLLDYTFPVKVYQRGMVQKGREVNIFDFDHLFFSNIYEWNRSCKNYCFTLGCES